MNIRPLIKKNKNKLILIILDGLGGLPSKNNKTELEYANTPNMDKLARENELGLLIPVDYGITPGSGPGHLGVFGYEPDDYHIGRGILEALGIDVHVDKNTITARCNFATIDKNGNIIDRRAGRIPTEKNKELIKVLSNNIKEVNGKSVEFYSGKEHRFVFVIRDIDSQANVNDTDPQDINIPPLKAEGDNDSIETANIINTVSKKIKELLEKEERANYALFRGISKMPDIPTMEENFGLKPACIASYPMYRGLAKLVGMDILSTGKTIEDEINTLIENFNKYDYFFFHVKKTDSYGEDGNFDKKVKVIEEFDSHLPEILNMGFNVIAITGDHSTPSKIKAHSYHPVPLLLIHENTRKNSVNGFSEMECLKGAIGQIKSKYLINLMLAGADRLKKYGA